MITKLNHWLRAIPNWVVYVLCGLPAPLLFMAALNGALGPEPIEALEHEYGQFALQLLIASLFVTPLRRFWGVNLLKFRRALGVMSFIYATLHLLVWVVLDMALRWREMWAEIVERPYITIGMLAFVLMVPLALTSNGASIRRLGAAAWRRLHRLAYPLAILAAVHFVMVQKVWEAEALIYLSLVLVLLAVRIAPKQKVLV